MLEAAVTKRGNKHSDKIATDRFASSRSALMEPGATDKQPKGRRLGNRVENAHLPLRRRQRAMQHVRRMRRLQKFAAVSSSVHNPFNQERPLTDRNRFKQTRTAVLLRGADVARPKGQRQVPAETGEAFVWRHPAYQA